MSKLSKIYTATTLSLLLSSTTAFADLTKEEVWDSWHKYMSSAGATINVNKDASGNVLTITDIIMSMPSGTDNEDLLLTLPMMTFTEQGDGSVKIDLPPSSKVSVDTTLATGEKTKAVINYAQDGLNIIATGESGNLTYTYTTNSVDLSLDKLSVDGSDIGTDIAKANISMNGLSGTSSIIGDEPFEFVQKVNTTTLSYDLAFADPDNISNFKAIGAIQNFTSDSRGKVPGGGIDSQDMSAMLEAGFNVIATITYQGGNMDLAFDGPDGAGTVNTSSTGGTLGLTMDANGLAYDAGQTDLAFNALVPDIPIPLTLNMAMAKVNFAMPIQKSDEEQDFALGFTMDNFTISDVIWGMLDPSAQLPRDPATLALDLSGKVKVLFDFMNPDQAAALESSGTAPGELNALTLKKLVVDAVGARLTGAGDFTFDNSDLASFGGMPRPKGAVDLKLVGGNGLLDNLVSVGVLPEQQAMGARLMMGLFAVAGPEADTLKSKIEINDEGHILANGQRIQ